MKHKRQDKTEQQTEEKTTEAIETMENPDTSADWEAKYNEARQQADDARGKYLYLLSDFENFKRNAAKERIELQQTAGRDIVTALLPVLDDFDRAAKNGALGEGMALIHQKLLTTLLQKGLTSIDIQPGADFNPDTQEAVAEIPAGADNMKGKIIDIVEKGYQLGERIIRFAKVVVGR